MIYQATAENITRAADYLRRGELVAFPTETVYGLGADARNDQAVAKIFEVKNRPTINPLIVHVDAFEKVGEYADLSSDVLRARLQKLATFWPGPLSVVLPRRSIVSSLACAGLDSVAIRIPDHPVALALLQECGFGVAAPSANRSTYVSPTSAAHVEEGLGQRIAMILDGGPCRVGVESTIVSLVSEHPELLRPGGVPLESLESVLPDIVVKPHHTPSAEQQPLSPGLLREHYAPQTPIALRGACGLDNPQMRVGLIAFSEDALHQDAFPYDTRSVLSESGDLTEIAAKLFAAIREQDKLGLDLIVVDSCPQIGLGRAIMDRLLRATAKFQN